MTWLASDFAYPQRLDLPTGHHLRPIRASDAEIDLPAVMGSRESLFEIYGGPWGWPPETMTVEADAADLQHHADEMEAREGFNFAILDTNESELFGCVYLYPPGEEGADADVSWWLVDKASGTDLERELARALPVWFSEVWGFTAPRRHP
jgi:RimJ/RimL family protein N-acetyltransferase